MSAKKTVMGWVELHKNTGTEQAPVKTLIARGAGTVSMDVSTEKHVPNYGASVRPDRIVATEISEKIEIETDELTPALAAIHANLPITTDVSAAGGVAVGEGVVEETGLILEVYDKDDPTVLRYSRTGFSATLAVDAFKFNKKNFQTHKVTAEVTGTPGKVYSAAVA